MAAKNCHMKEQAHAILNMKLTFISLTLLFLATTAYSQVTTERTPSQEHYLQKSKFKKKAGWVLTGSGFGMAVAGAITLTAHNPLWNPNEPQTSIGATMTVFGLTSMLGGVISFISAGHHKRKARKAGISHTQILLPQPRTVITKAAPAVSLQITF